MRGRKPVPSALALIRGNPGRRPMNADEPSPTAAVTYDPPDWLQPLAREEWSRLGSELSRLGLLTIADLPAFAAYCAEVGTFREMESTLTNPGQTPKGKPKKLSGARRMQLLGMRRKAGQEIRKWASEFGLTPSARVRLKSDPPKPEDPLARFLRRPGA